MNIRHIGKNTMLKGAFILTSSSIFLRFIGFIYRILLSRNIGSEGMGVLQLVMSVLFTSLSLVSAGVPLAVSRLVAQKNAVQDLYGVRRVLFTALGFVISVSLLICIVLILNVNWIANNIVKEPRIQGALLAIFPAIIMMSISGVFKGYFYGIKNFYPPAFSEIVEEIITIALVLYLLPMVNHLDISIQITAVSLGVVIGELSSLLYLNVSYHRIQSKQPPCISKVHSSFPLMDILKISGPITLIRLVSSLGSSISSILIPQRLVKSGTSHSQAMSTLGILNGMVMPLIFLPFTFVNSLAVVMIPNLSEDLARKNWDQIASKVSKSIFITSIFALPFGALMTALADPIGILLYKQKEVGPILELMAYISVINALSHTLSAILNGLGKQNRSAIYAFIGEIIDIGCIFFLVGIPSLRIHGYIIGFVVSTLVVLLLQFITVRKITKVSLMWSKWFLKPLLASLLTTSVTRLLYLWLYNEGCTLFLSLSVSALIGIIIYLFVLLITGNISHIKDIAHKTS